jgi:hypothetical protein
VITQPAPGFASRQETRLQSWIDRTDAVISRRVEDAVYHAHALSSGSADLRLQELGELLLREIGDAREAFYGHSFRFHARRIGSDAEPGHEAAEAMREARVLGYFLKHDIGSHISHAQKALSGAQAAGGGPHLRLWSETHGPILRRFAATALTDSQTAIHHAVGRVMRMAGPAGE